MALFLLGFAWSQFWFVVRMCCARNWKCWLDYSTTLWGILIFVHSSSVLYMGFQGGSLRRNGRRHGWHGELPHTGLAKHHVRSSSTVCRLLQAQDILVWPRGAPCCSALCSKGVSFFYSTSDWSLNHVLPKFCIARMKTFIWNSCVVNYRRREEILDERRGLGRINGDYETVDEDVIAPAPMEGAEEVETPPPSMALVERSRKFRTWVRVLD